MIWFPTLSFLFILLCWRDEQRGPSGEEEDLRVGERCRHAGVVDLGVICVTVKCHIVDYTFSMNTTLRTIIYMSPYCKGEEVNDKWYWGTCTFCFPWKMKGRLETGQGLWNLVGSMPGFCFFFRIEVIVAVLRTFEGVNSNYKYFTTPPCRCVQHAC